MPNLTADQHTTSPLGDMRERPVPCQVCRRMTANLCARCPAHCDHDATPEPVAAVEATLDEYEAEALPAITRHATPDQTQDLRATVGMARLLLDMARAHPSSPTTWDMLESTLKALQAKTGIVCDAMRQQQ